MTPEQTRLHTAVVIDAIRESVIMLSARGHLAQRSKERILAAFDADPDAVSSLAVFASERAVELGL